MEKRIYTVFPQTKDIFILYRNKRCENTILRKPHLFKLDTRLYIYIVYTQCIPSLSVIFVGAVRLILIYIFENYAIILDNTYLI